MEMCYDGALVMPSSYAVMDTEEMTYVEGGGKITINRDSIETALLNAFNVASGYGFLADLSAKQIGLKILDKAFQFGKYLLKFKGFTGFALQAAACALVGTIVTSALVIGVIYATDSTMTIKW